MYRNFVDDNNPFILYPDQGSDSQLWIRALGADSRGFKMNEIIAVYRRHDNSSTGIRRLSGKSFRATKNFVIAKINKAMFWNNYFDRNATSSVLKLKVKLYKKLAKEAYFNHEFLFFIFYFLKYLLAILRQLIKL